MRSIFGALFALLLSCACSPPSPSQSPPDNEAIARRLADQTDISQDLERTRAAEKAIRSIAEAGRGLIEPRVDTSTAFAHVEAKARARLSAFYLEHLTGPQLREIDEFYQSRAGKAYAAAIPKLQRSIDEFDSEDEKALETLEREAIAGDAEKRRLTSEILALPGVTHSLARPVFILDIQLVRPPGVAPPPGEAEDRARQLTEQSKMRERGTRAVKAQQQVFFARRFSEPDLKTILAYLKSDGGSAMVRLHDQAEAAATEVMVQAALSIVPALTDPLCRDRKCTAEERRDVEEAAAQFRQFFRSMIALEPESPSQ